jgi:hypothetical protein
MNWHCRLPTRILCAALILSLGIAYDGHAMPFARSTFDNNAEDWTVTGDSTSATPTYIAGGGNPGGYLTAMDSAVGGVWYWEAPTKFLGNKRGAYGYSLTYDLRMRGNGPLFDSSDVILDGAGISLQLVLTPPVPANLEWTTYSATLSAAADWRVDAYDGPLASEVQIKAVLANITRLRIRGEFITGSDIGDLDNVILNGLPGDFDFDGDVDGRDLLVWQRNRSLGSLADWRTNYGLGALASSQVVPEPSQFIFVGFSCLAAIASRSLVFLARRLLRSPGSVPSTRCS